jgi:hypothetical protein
MEEIKHLSNQELLELFLEVVHGDPGPNVADAIADIENAGEDKTSTLVKKARKIVIRYLEKYMHGEDAEIFEDEEEWHEIEGFGEGKRKGRRTRSSRRGRTRKGRKGRTRKGRSRKCRSSRKCRK